MDFVTNNSVYTQIKVLVTYYEEREYDHQKLITMDVPTSNIEIQDILATAFAKYEVSKDSFGYKLVDDHTERRLHVMNIRNKPDLIHYGIKVLGPTARLQEFSSFSNMFNSKKFSDVTLRVGDTDIHAHKIILADKSSVFEAMFTHEMSESQSNRVEIKDIDYDTMCDLLHYFYTGKLRGDYENDEFAKYSNLLVAANKYCAESLKVKCEEKLFSVLTNENVLDCLVLADLHNAVNLKIETIHFVVGNAEEIIELPSYKSFLVLQPDLAVETIRALAYYNEEKNVESDAKKRKI